MTRGNARLIYLHKLDEDELRAIRKHVKDELAPVSDHTLLTALLQRWVRACGEKPIPIERDWVERPYASSYVIHVGSLESPAPFVRSRGFIAGNITAGGKDPTGWAEKTYQAEFRHDRTSIRAIESLDELNIPEPLQPLPAPLRKPTKLSRALSLVQDIYDAYTLSPELTERAEDLLAK